jgi:ribosomal protein L22
MSTRRTTAATSNARVTQEQVRRAIDRVSGLSADQALKVLRFSPSFTCEPVHQLVSRAVADLTVPQVKLMRSVIFSFPVDGGGSARRRRMATSPQC